MQNIQQTPRQESGEGTDYWWQDHWKYVSALEPKIYQRAIKANLAGNRNALRLALQKTKAN